MGNYCEQLLAVTSCWDSSPRPVIGRRARGRRRRAGHLRSGHMTYAVYEGWVTSYAYAVPMVSVDISLTPSLDGTTLALS